jgi:hypothetical protein
MFLKAKSVHYKAFLNILLITTFGCFAQPPIEVPIQTEYNHYFFNTPALLKIQMTFINSYNYSLLPLEQRISNTFRIELP